MREDAASPRGPGGDGGPHPLDNPARAALLGPHAHLAIRRGSVLRYPADVTPFIALPDEPDAETWRDAAALLGPGALLPLAGFTGTPPPGWEALGHVPGVQMVGDDVAARPDPEAVVLGPDDVADILALVARTRPGPFLPRTIALGTYLGIRRGGELVAMAGERMHPPGWTEISAVCTDPAHRGEGLGTRLVHAVTALVRARGETPFLHATAANTTAIRLYEQLGFRLRREVVFTALRVPGGDGTAPNPFAGLHGGDASRADGARPVISPPRQPNSPTRARGEEQGAGR
ncbi:putative acetyltransferase (Partial) [Frankia canadensis]|uniref:Putative acetyltransferase (Partial) n=1 Tax=Frankia canadensis TaxID=1836972 RepID=A0A2I2KVB2_9ACTN|nr:GNAT family N-acetyltransferase [Frankia canadensis]SNQ49596.1 putative acetyltransferase (Partial) [Frankia canadensis]SOU56886.1 putative acetyltransferase (Partial) [Frankia canadensis]